LGLEHKGIRDGQTLMEVLVAIFIMGIGMLALLTLFPLGALNVARALQDDRTASAAALAENIALAQDIRHDPQIVSTPSNAFLNPFPTQPQYNLPANATGPSWPVYVDAFGVLLGSTSIGAVGNYPGLPRRSVTFAPSYPAAVRWFALMDDITFQPNGVPDTVTSGFVQRGEKYTWAYLLRRPRASSDAVTDLSVIVYYGRTTDVLAGENAYSATGSKDTNAVVLIWDPTTQEKPAVKIGTWILDSSCDIAPDGTILGPSHGDFYRVVNVIEDPATPGQLTLELQNNLRANINAATVMEGVVEVFDKGDGWQP